MARTHKVGQMDVAVRVKQDVVRLDVPVYDALTVYVADGAAELCYPEAHGVLCKCLARDVEAEVTAVHQINDDVAVAR